MDEDCCPACGRENDTEDEYCYECTRKHNLGKEAMDRELDSEHVKKCMRQAKIDCACRLCLEDVLQWLETGMVDGTGFDEPQIIDEIRKTLSGERMPEDFQSGDEE